MKKYSVLICLLLVSGIIGCGPRRPESMPNTAPCSITVLENGVPMAGVDVFLYRETGNGALSIG